KGWEAYDPERYGIAALGLAHDTGVGAKCHLALALSQLGFLRAIGDSGCRGAVARGSTGASEHPGIRVVLWRRPGLAAVPRQRGPSRLCREIARAWRAAWDAAM